MKTKTMINMVEKNKKIKEINQISKDKLEQKDTLKKPIKSNDILYMIVGIMVTILLLLAFIFQNKILKNKSKEIVKNENNVQNNQLNKNEDLKIQMEFQGEFQRLSVSIKSLQNQINYNKEYLETLEAKINELETNINNININPQKIELIKLALGIKNDIKSGNNYFADLSTFKSLSKNNVNIEKELNILEEYKNTILTEENIEETFKKELKIFAKDNNKLAEEKNGRISKFFSNFVVIRKVKNPEENTADEFILGIENNIKLKEYSLALLTIENNKDYLNYFPNTEKNLKTYILLDNSIEEIIKYLVNK